MRDAAMNTSRSIVAGAALLTLPAEAQVHRLETDPVVTVRENFVACDVLSQLQRVMDDPRFLLTGECEPRLVAWYRALYAPRAGGAYDSHHRTAGVAGRTRRRSDSVAARGAGAAGRPDAAYWHADGARCKRS